MSDAKPNLLVFFCDQLQKRLLGCYGQKLVRTPNLDRLAAESAVFDNAYTPTAICSPARASLMTGVYPHTHHMFNNSTPGYSYCHHLRPEMTMIQDWFADNTDYETAYFGKWHIGPATDLFASRFQHTQKPGEANLPYLASSHWHPSGNLGGNMVHSVARGSAGTLDTPLADFPDVYAATRTNEFLDSMAQKNRPFLAFCAFPGPHSPWKIPEEFGIRYAPADIPLPANRHDRFTGKPISQRKMRLRESLRKSDAQNDDTLRELMTCCYSYLELIDEQVGRVVAKLKALGQYENTLIVFTADHGDMAGAHGFLSKGSYMYDEIYRIPMLLKPAGAAQSRPHCNEPVCLMDVTATLLHAAQGTPVHAMNKQTLHGQSLLPLVDGQGAWDRTVSYCEYHGDWYGHYSARMVTDGKIKLVWNLSDLSELYDLENDPHELKNLFLDPAYTEVRDKYLAILKAEAERCQDGQMKFFDTVSEGLTTTDTTQPLDL
ncbi:MAG: Choline-sulfatase [Planctomycetes bacterium ADurb.Bin412]|nr:MAG: Choline-sulfatase [Planctomycetes bacterium ADurb.Bin412]